MKRKNDVFYYDSSHGRQAFGGQTDDLYLSIFGIVSCPSLQKNFGPAPHNDWLIYFILEGNGIYCLDGQLFKLQKGDAFLIPPGRSDYYHIADSQHPWQYMYIGFNGRKAQIYLSHTGLSVSHPVSHLYIPSEDLIQLSQDLMNAGQLTLSNEIKRVGCIYKMFSLLAASYQNAHPKSVFRDYSSRTYALYAKEYIVNNYAQTNITSLASQIGIDRSYLHSIFKKYFGTSPQEYLIHCRLHAAERLLTGTGLSIKEIASECGYENPLQFSKLFKKHYQISPSKYRIDHSQKGDASS